MRQRPSIRRGSRPSPIEERPAAIYLRISDDREGKRLGVERQEEDCRELAARLRLPVAEVFCDNDIGASTRSRKPRPAFSEMMRRAEAGEFAAILSYSSSRITRRVTESERVIRLVEETGVQLHTVASGNYDLTTAQGRGMARQAAVWDTMEAEQIAERVKRAARQRAERGEWHGGPTPPFGYEYARTRDGRVTRLRVHAVNADLLREAAGRFLGGESLYGICADWNARQLTTTRGAPWRPKTLRNALLSPAVIGCTQTEDGALHPAKWEPILERITWDRLQDVLHDPVRLNKPRSGSYAARHALGGGITVCVCGKKLLSQPRNGQDRLVCLKQATGGCGRIVINYGHLEEFVLRMVWEVLDTPEVRRGLARRGKSKKDEKLREELAEVHRRLDRNYDAYLEGDVDRDRYLRHKHDLEERAARLEASIHDVTSSQVAVAVGSLSAAQERWARGDVPWRRAFISALLREIRVGPHPPGVAMTMTRRRAETDDEFAERVREHRAEVMRARVTLDWRA